MWRRADGPPLRPRRVQRPGDRRGRRRLLEATQALARGGALITALAFDLFQESFKRGGSWLSAVGLLGGADTFVVADELFDRYIGGEGSGVSAFATAAGFLLSFLIAEL